MNLRGASLRVLASKDKNLLDSLAMPGISLVPHLQGFIDTSRSSRWDSSSEKSIRERDSNISSFSYLKIPFSVVRSTSTVGLPLES